jgi:hypothetical protein
MVWFRFSLFLSLENQDQFELDVNSSVTIYDLKYMVMQSK